MEGNKIRVVVSTPIGKIEVEGDIEYVKESINDVPEIVESLSKLELPQFQVATSVASETGVSMPEQTTFQDTDVPHITNTKSSRDAIFKALDSTWGMTPQTYNDIQEALRTNAIVYPDSTIRAALTLMTKAGKLRRVKEQGKWAYVIAR